jgi:hypothetical protein
LIFVPDASLSAGLALSLLVALLLRGLICPAAPAGVYAPSTTINRKKTTITEPFLISAFLDKDTLNLVMAD